MRGATLILVAGLLAGCPGPKEAPPYYQEVLSAAPFTRLVVEVDHAPGHRPSDAALAHLVSTFRNVTSKAEVTLLVQESAMGGEDERWSQEELLDAEERLRTTAHEAPTAVLHVLYPAGAYEKDGVAGLTIAGTRIGPIVVFLGTIREVDAGLGPLPLAPGAVQRLERATLLHEAGHGVGLVDNGLPMTKDREDKEHEGHSTNPRSVMYWRVESVDGLRDYLLSDGAVPSEFDADDRADIRSAGGR